jgi:hypothetical protein
MAERIAEWAKRPLPKGSQYDYWITPGYREWVDELTESCKWGATAEKEIRECLNNPLASIIPVLEEHLFTKVD